MTNDWVSDIIDYLAESEPASPDAEAINECLHIMDDFCIKGKKRVKLMTVDASVRQDSLRQIH